MLFWHTGTIKWLKNHENFVLNFVRIHIFVCVNRRISVTDRNAKPIPIKFMVMSHMGCTGV